MTPALLLGDGYEWDDYHGNLLPDLHHGNEAIALTNPNAIYLYLGGYSKKVLWPKDLDLKDRKAVKLYIESIILTGA